MGYKSEAGKGSIYRPVDRKKWDKNWSKIFGKKKRKKERKILHTLFKKLRQPCPFCGSKNWIWKTGTATSVKLCLDCNKWWP